MVCKFNGRTVVLSMIVFQLCALYCVVYETISAIVRGDRSVVAGSQDFGLFLVIQSAVELLAICGGLVLIFSAAVKSFIVKKSLVIVIFGLNFILILPFNISGIYLYFASSSSTSFMDVSQSTHFAFSNFLQPSNNDTKLPREVAKIQEENCCCGLTNQTDFLPKNSNTSLFCPTTEKSCRHRKGQFHSCLEVIPRTMRNLVLVAACIGAFCSLLAICITPFIYAYFEKDRRQARANAIQMWRSAIRQLIDKRKKEISFFSG